MDGPPQRGRDVSPEPSADSAIAQPITPMQKHLLRKRGASSYIEVPYFGRRVQFEDGYEPGLNVYDPMKVSVVVCGRVVLTEREADYQLSQSVSAWKKLLFLLTNVPYTIMAVSSLFLVRVEHHAFAYMLFPLCESPTTYSVLSTCVALSSFLLHSSQVRVGHWCCSTSRARTFHRRRVQDRLDVADCACAAVAVLGAVACQGINEIGPAMMAAVPVFFASLLAKKLQWHNLYLCLHGLWHIATAATLWHVFVPPASPLRTFVAEWWPEALM